jgi:GNAT superfamily N-acetyltransferase
MTLRVVTAADRELVRDFLRAADLTTAGLEGPWVRLWADRDAEGRVVGSTGFELSADGQHALIRSVAVAPTARSAGVGTRLATFALREAARAGAKRAWLFSRRSGPFWQRLGFLPGDRDALAAVLPTAEQVRLFAATGQLGQEVAWTRELPPEPGTPPLSPR